MIGTKILNVYVKKPFHIKQLPCLFRQMNKRFKEALRKALIMNIENQPAFFSMKRKLLIGMDDEP